MNLGLKRWDEVLRRLPPGRCKVAEIGVWKGRMSEQLLSRNPQMKLVLVDLWAPGTSNPSWLQSGSKMAAEPPAVHEDAYRGVLALAERFAPRVSVVRQASSSAAAVFCDGDFDLVFIDADHGQLAVLADITAWRPRVKAGGWIGGHDYGSARFPGVKDAVHQVFPRDQVEVGANCTWWVRL